MFKKKPDVDIVMDILEALLRHNPDGVFANSLYHQYQERGGLSKKQLEGLLSKAQKLNTIPESKLVTLQAMLLKRPNRYKSAPPPPTPLYEKDTASGALITAILNKYPQHKRVFFFNTKYNNNEPLTPAEKTELEKFARLLLKD
jgi:hypothetical protein